MDIRPVAAILTGRLLDHSARVVHPGRRQKGGAFPHETPLAVFGKVTDWPVSQEQGRKGGSPVRRQDNACTVKEARRTYSDR